MTEPKRKETKVVDTLHLEVHPSVVFKLGADLITDDMQALIELIKNSYDADATYVRVYIDTHSRFHPITGELLDDKDVDTVAAVADREGGRPEDENSGDAPSLVENRYLLGSITVVDDGIGMDLERIRRGWLTVSLSEKQAMKSRGETTDRKRTPLGDKGLGRLGAQRLGEQMIMTTLRQTKDHSTARPLEVTVNWNEFARADSLSLVPLDVRELPVRNMRSGTRLEIRGLRDVSFWRQHDTNDLQKELATMISPYEGVAGFRISLSIDKEFINLREKAQKILLAAPVSYQFKFNGERMTVTGNFTTTFLRPSAGVVKTFQYTNNLLGATMDSHSLNGYLLGRVKHENGLSV